MKLQLFWNGSTAYKLFKVTGASGSPTYSQITLPSLTLTKRRPCFVEYWNNYILTSNFWDEVLLTYDDGVTVGAFIAGIDAPSGAGVTITSGAGSLTATVVEAYITYVYEDANGLKMAESNPSPNLLASDLILVNGKVTWNGLPTSSPAPGRANRIYFYLGLEGFIARKVGSKPFDMTTTFDFSGSAATVSQGIALPNDGVEIRTAARSRPPEARYIRTYHRRVFYARTADHPYRIYYSEIDEPESVDPSNYFDTLGKETITGIGEQADALLVFGRTTTYALQGWSSGRSGVPSDMSFRRVHPSIGCVNHHSILNINKNLYYWAMDGLRVWNGGTNWLGQKSTSMFDFLDGPAQFYTGCAINDSRERFYIFMPYLGVSAPDSFAYYYEPADPDLGGGASELPFGFFKRARTDTVRVSWREPNGSIIQLTGSVDGYVRKENVLSDVDDDNDTYQKRWVLIPKHNFMGIPGGGLLFEGKHFVRAWVYMNCQTGSVNFKVWAGDEKAYTTAFAPQRDDTQLDPVVTWVDAGFQYSSAAKSVWEYKIDLSGRGLTLGTEVAAPPVDSVWYGYTTVWKPGSSGRLAKTRVAV